MGGSWCAQSEPTQTNAEAEKLWPCWETKSGNFLLLGDSANHSLIHSRITQMTTHFALILPDSSKMCVKGPKRGRLKREDIYVWMSSTFLFLTEFPTKEKQHFLPLDSELSILFFLVLTMLFSFKVGTKEHTHTQITSPRPVKSCRPGFSVHSAKRMQR